MTFKDITLFKLIDQIVQYTLAGRGVVESIQEVPAEGVSVTSPNTTSSKSLITHCTVKVRCMRLLVLELSILNVPIPGTSDHSPFVFTTQPGKEIEVIHHATGTKISLKGGSGDLHVPSPLLTKFLADLGLDRVHPLP